MIGSGIGGSKSPALHMAEAKALGFRLTYERFDAAAGDFDPDQLDALLTRLQADGFAGVNVTHPFKQRIMDHLDTLSPDARALGAVNTIVFRDGRRVGYNPDWIGWKRGFERALPDARLGRVVQLGAGGAGSAVAYAALTLGVGHLVLHDVDAGRAAGLCENLRGLFGAARVEVAESLPPAIAAADGLINATPIGMQQYPGTPVDVSLLRPELWVAEIVYVPPETELLKQARRIGCTTVDGVGMVVFQAAVAFELFTGRVPDPERMLRAFHGTSLAGA